PPMGQAHRGPTGVALSLFPPFTRPDHLVGTGEKSKPCTEAEQRGPARENGGNRPVPWRVGVASGVGGRFSLSRKVKYRAEIVSDGACQSCRPCADMCTGSRLLRRTHGAMA